jgi:UDP-N-acetylglucosamine--N-acetylmuramyl-(pentapeptide) pyrophosphoryl-undecaprenol N-acetylglucosamine transferase
VSSNPDIDKIYTVHAGKLRRYHGEGLRQLLDLKTVAFNIRDGFRTLAGCVESLVLMRKLKADVLFVKGGFVGVPVGLAAAALRVPFVTHDSDAIPGLANRIISRWAAVHAVALPAEVYHYPKNKTQTVGVPVHANYAATSSAAGLALREELGLSAYEKVIFVTGGGLGAQRLNEAMIQVVPELLEMYPKLAIIQSVGRNNEQTVNSAYAHQLTPEELARVTVKGYVTDMYRYSGAADVVITRAGATALAEFAVQGKACIVVPNPYLTSGHQLKNADYLTEKKAVRVVNEDELATELYKNIRSLLDDAGAREALAANLSQFAVPDAAKQLAVILLKQARALTE